MMRKRTTVITVRDLSDSVEVIPIESEMAFSLFGRDVSNDKIKELKPVFPILFLVYTIGTYLTEKSLPTINRL